MQNGLPMKETRPSIRRGETPELKDNRHCWRKVGRETILHYALCIMHLNRSRPVPFQQRTNTSWWSTRSQPAVSRRLFRCLGAHLLRSPQNVKFVSLFLAMWLAAHGHTTPVSACARPQRSSSPNSICRQKTSPGCRVIHVHRSFIFR